MSNVTKSFWGGAMRVIGIGGLAAIAGFLYQSGKEVQAVESRVAELQQADARQLQRLEKVEAAAAALPGIAVNLEWIKATLQEQRNKKTP